MTSADHDETTQQHGAEGSGSANSALPFAPSKDDDSPVGSTDQHSTAPTRTPDEKEDGVHQDPSSTD